MALPPTGYRKPAPSVISPVMPRPPLPEDRSDNARMPYPLGDWAGDKFVFKSPEAEKQWQKDSFMQGSHHLLWMKGRRLRPDENTLAGMGLPRSDDTYRGPDGQHYQTTPMSREDPHMTMLRAAHLATEPAQGSATEMGQRASEKALPQAMAMMAQGGRVEAQPPAANDNRTAANENQPPTPASAAPQGIGRFAAMAQATKDPASRGPTLAEIGQDVADTVRLTANAVTLDNADKLSAAANAVGSALAGGKYGETYRDNLAKEQRETEAARKRMGLLGAVEEVAPTFIPGYGDALGVAGDLKMYRDHPEERTWKNYGMTALGALPFIPSVAGSIKKVDRALDAAEDGAKAVAKESEAATQLRKTEHAESADWDAILSEAETRSYTEAEALKLGGEHKGLIFVHEAPQGKGRGLEFQDGTAGARYDVATHKSAQPALRYQNENPNGVNYVKFDGFEKAPNGDGLVLIDAKTRLPFERPEAMEELKLTMGRVRHALQQNPGYSVVYEFPNEKAVRDARIFIQENRFGDEILVRVRKP